MINMFSGVLFMPFIGRLLDYAWQGEYVNGVAVFTTAEYTFALSSITVSLFLACCIIVLIEEKYPKEEKG